MIERVPYSEDYFFCYLMRNTGIGIFADTNMKLRHRGADGTLWPEEWPPIPIDRFTRLQPTSMKLTAITCTTPARAEALELCKEYVARQTRQPDQWLILDGPEPMQNKLADAISGGKVEGDYVVFAEDDDWFSPHWFKWCEDRLARGLRHGWAG